jgi:1-acyl-sn-glycerol-3-phosphate acyltransferase
VENPVRQRTLTGIGRSLYPAMFKIARRQVESEYILCVEGRENIPETPSVIVAPHQTHQDVKSFLVASGKLVNTLNAVDGGSTRADWFSLELTGATPILRGQHELAKEQQKGVQQSMIQKVRNGQTQLVFSEATYCPIFNDMMTLHKGSAVGVASKTGVPVIPAMAVYTPNNDWGVESLHIEFDKPFLPDDYSDLVTAAAALRERMIAKKVEMNARYNPGMTQADFSLFRQAQIAKYPDDPDYRQGYVHSADWRLARTGEEKAALSKLFLDN